MYPSLFLFTQFFPLSLSFENVLGLLMEKMVTLNMCDIKIKKHWHTKNLETSEGRTSHL
jgi:hypothetical protein